MGHLCQSGFFLLSLGVLQCFFPLHSFLTFHLNIRDDGHDDGKNDYHDDGEDDDFAVDDVVVDSDAKRIATVFVMLTTTMTLRMIINSKHCCNDDNDLIIVKLGKVVDDDGDWKSHNENTTDRATRPDQFAQSWWWSWW